VDPEGSVFKQAVTLADDHLIALQHEQRLSNHPHSECSKAPVQPRHPTPLIGVGDLVYLHSDLNKSRAHNGYLVVEAERYQDRVHHLSRFCDMWGKHGSGQPSQTGP